MAGRAKRCLPNPDAGSIVGNERDLGLLETLAWAGCLSTSQVMRLHFPSRRTAQRRIRALLDHGLVRSHLNGGALHRNNVLTLSPRGAEFLAERGTIESESIGVRRLPRVSKLAHALAVRDVFVEFVVAERIGCFHLLDFRFEEEMARHPAFRSVGLIPDALASSRREGAMAHVALEVDLGNEPLKSLASKLEAYRRLRQDAVPGGLSLLFVCGERRRARLTASARQAPDAPHVTFSSPEGVRTLLARGYPHGPFAPAIRSVRMGDGGQPGDFRSLSTRNIAPFRPL